MGWKAESRLEAQRGGLWDEKRPVAEGPGMPGPRSGLCNQDLVYP